MDIPLEVFMQVRVGAIGMFAGLLVAGCTASSSSPVSNEVITSPPATASVRPTPTPTAVVHKVLKPGAKGEEVRLLQRTLASLHYDPGTVDGRFGQGTLWALWAF